MPEPTPEKKQLSNQAGEDTPFDPEAYANEQLRKEVERKEAAEARAKKVGQFFRNLGNLLPKKEEPKP